jgi:DNA-binding NtrC family response regulator
MHLPMTGDTISYVADTPEDQVARGPAPQLILAIEAQRPTAPAARFSLVGVDEVVLGRGAQRLHVRVRDRGRGYLRIFIPDAWMSSEHARLVRGEADWQLRDCDSKNGTFLDGLRVSSAQLEPGQLIEIGNTLLWFRSYPDPGPREPADVSRCDIAEATSALATLNPNLRRELSAVPRISAAAVPVLLLGETGTGKEVLARAIHTLSERPGGFVAVNCGALPPTLIESELFGARKGAYSGAVEDRPGLIRTADRGTLFLDEIAELPESSQAALLRVLQEHEVTPVGGTRPYPVDIRIVAATHQDLAARVASGRFRRDLYARIVGFQLTLPPLRERSEDIGLLIGELLPRLAPTRCNEIRFTRAAARALLRFEWPLNIRELEHALAAAIALTDGDEIGLEQLPANVRGTISPGTGEHEPSGPEPRLDSDEQELRGELLRLVRAHRGNISAVARVMGKERVQIRRWCKRFGLDPEAYR